jgi:protein-tyrosine phosphatase
VEKVFWIDPADTASEPNLAIVLCPRGGNVLEDELLRMKRCGIDTVVSLLETDEAEWLGLTREGLLAADMGLGFLSHPIPDAQTPTDVTAFRAFVDGLADRLRAGVHLGVHCRGSIGRSTITAACTLMHLGWTAKAALRAIGTARGCPVPDTPEQRRWILSYEANP